jgi:hypothetical protein
MLHTNSLVACRNQLELVQYSLYQGGPNFFFPQVKNSTPVRPKGQETPPSTIFKNYLPGFEVLTAVGTKMAVFWVVSPCSLVEIYQRFRGPCCLHHQGDEQGPLKRW